MSVFGSVCCQPSSHDNGRTIFHRNFVCFLFFCSVFILVPFQLHFGAYHRSLMRFIFLCYRPSSNIFFSFFLLYFSHFRTRIFHYALSWIQFPHFHISCICTWRTRAMNVLCNGWTRSYGRQTTTTEKYWIEEWEEESIENRRIVSNFYECIHKWHGKGNFQVEKRNDRRFCIWFESSGGERRTHDVMCHTEEAIVWGYTQFSEIKSKMVRFQFIHILSVFPSPIRFTVHTHTRT